MIPVSTANVVAETLRDAARACGEVRQIRYELDRRAAEWFRAARDADDEDLVVELLGSLSPGMQVPVIGAHNSTWGTIVRVLVRDGQCSLHVEEETGRPLYLNFSGPTAPVAVRA